MEYFGIVMDAAASDAGYFGLWAVLMACVAVLAKCIPYPEAQPEPDPHELLGSMTSALEQELSLPSYEAFDSLPSRWMTEVTRTIGGKPRTLMRVRISLPSGEPARMVAYWDMDPRRELKSLYGLHEEVRLLGDMLGYLRGHEAILILEKEAKAAQ